MERIVLSINNTKRKMCHVIKVKTCNYRPVIVLPLARRRSTVFDSETNVAEVCHLEVCPTCLTEE